MISPPEAGVERIRPPGGRPGWLTIRRDPPSLYVTEGTRDALPLPLHTAQGREHGTQYCTSETLPENQNQTEKIQLGNIFLSHHSRARRRVGWGGGTP